MGEGEGEMIWENGIETCIISCKKRIASLGSTQDTGCLGLVHWDDPERWYREGGWRGVQDGDHLHTRGRLRMALKHVYYHVRNESPVYVQCRIQDARGWCTGMTQRDVMGREVGGGFMFGNACTPVVDSCQCMAKPI